MLQNKSGITAQGMGASHLSRGMAVPALAAVEGSALTPGNTLNAVSESSMIYSMCPPPPPGLQQPLADPPLPQQVWLWVHGPASSWQGGQSINVCEMHGWVMLPPKNASGAMSSCPRSVCKRKPHLQGGPTEHMLTARKFHMKMKSMASKGSKIPKI